jgi:hypothetical protein
VNKKAIAILGAIFILIVGTLGFLIYSRSKSDDPEVDANINTETPIEETPVVEEPTEQAPAGAAVKLTDVPVLSPVLFFQGIGISYFDSDGHLYQSDLQISNGAALLSNKRELSIDLRPGISKVLWPLAGKGFIAEFNSGSRPSWSYFDTPKNQYFDIPKQVYSLDWMPAGDKIIYTWVDSSGKATLQFANPDATGYSTITDLFVPDNIIKVSPDGKNVLLYRNQTNDVTKNVINMVSTDGKTFTSVIKDGYNFGVLWSPDSKKFLFSRRDAGTQKFTLWVADISTGDIRSLGVTGSPTKAVWTKDSQVIYAGVPITGNLGQGLTQDSIKKIIVASGEQKDFTTGVAVDAQDMFLSLDETVLFFRNAQDNALYYIPVN